MPTKIRLQRHGKKGQPFYHIVVADGRAPRNGRFIERIGTYNPLTNPATVVLNFDRALYWVKYLHVVIYAIGDVLSDSVTGIGIV